MARNAAIMPVCGPSLQFSQQNFPNRELTASLGDPHPNPLPQAGEGTEKSADCFFLTSLQGEVARSAGEGTTGEQRMTRFNVVVLGGGLVGCAAAYYRA
jgi:hypothetical protein